MPLAPRRSTRTRSLISKQKNFAKRKFNLWPVTPGGRRTSARAAATRPAQPMACARGPMAPFACPDGQELSEVALVGRPAAAGTVSRAIIPSCNFFCYVTQSLRPLAGLFSCFFFFGCGPCKTPKILFVARLNCSVSCLLLPVPSSSSSFVLFCTCQLRACKFGLFFEFLTFLQPFPPLLLLFIKKLPSSPFLFMLLLIFIRPLCSAGL